MLFKVLQVARLCHSYAWHASCEINGYDPFEVLKQKAEEQGPLTRHREPRKYQQKQTFAHFEVPANT